MKPVWETEEKSMEDGDKAKDSSSDRYEEKVEW